MVWFTIHYLRQKSLAAAAAMSNPGSGAVWWTVLALPLHFQLRAEHL
jgi:hypothetical protein